MTATPYITLWCDDGDDDETGTHRCSTFREGNDSRAAHVRAEARAEGWEVGLPGGRDLCPRHAAERRARIERTRSAR